MSISPNCRPRRRNSADFILATVTIFSFIVIVHSLKKNHTTLSFALLTCSAQVLKRRRNPFVADIVSDCPRADIWVADTVQFNRDKHNQMIIHHINLYCPGVDDQVINYIQVCNLGLNSQFKCYAVHGINMK